MLRPGFNPWVGKVLWRWEWLPTPVFLPGELYGQRRLVSCSLWGRTESDMTEQLTHRLRGQISSFSSTQKKTEVQKARVIWEMSHSDLNPGLF